CGQPIGAERLESRPQANLCLACKGRQAKNAKSKFPPR
ncbi:MAG: TraR/DksA C4-type zinc finger protein, partial [Chloroflexi bacterium]|nr:TraR/DksA C4-type zinc finger protein [Chloroflexota bacterium]